MTDALFQLKLKIKSIEYLSKVSNFGHDNKSLYL